MTTCNDTLLAALDTMSKEQLIDLVCKLSIDGTFKLLNRDIAKLFYSEITAGGILLFIDLANMHGLNHKYGMSTADQFINNVLDQFRHSDTWIRWGSDEIVCVMASGDIVDFIGRLDYAMAENDLYAVYAYVTTSESLLETIERADTVCMNAKDQLDKFGLKARREDQYCRFTSTVVTE